MFCDERAGSTVLSAVHADPGAATPRPHAVGCDEARPEGRSVRASDYRAVLIVTAVVDRVVALLALAVLAPLLLVVAVAVRRTSGGPVLFRQTRVGRGGRTFTMLTFRTMYDGAERTLVELLAGDEPVCDDPFTSREDPRITPVGQLLRRFSLDGLPQLINVLTGSMSLVGPRPLLPAEAARHGAEARGGLARPGLTGSWRLTGRRGSSWEDALLELRAAETWCRT